MSVETGVRIDLARVATMLSREDGDGHHWTEEDARQWLLRMGFSGEATSGPDGRWCDDPRFLGWWSGRKTA